MRYIINYNHTYHTNECATVVKARNRGADVREVPDNQAYRFGPACMKCDAYVKVGK